jgi:hypothetical protein
MSTPARRPAVRHADPARSSGHRWGRPRGGRAPVRPPDGWSGELSEFACGATSCRCLVMVEAAAPPRRAAPGTERPGRTMTVTIGYQRPRSGALGACARVSAVDVRRSPARGLAADRGSPRPRRGGMGTPARWGRRLVGAARAGQHAGCGRCPPRDPAAQKELQALAELVRGDRRVCLLCFEADPAHCHRSLVAAALGALVPIRVVHLMPVDAT